MSYPVLVAPIIIRALGRHCKELSKFYDANQFLYATDTKNKIDSQRLVILSAQPICSQDDLVNLQQWFCFYSYIEPITSLQQKME